MPVWCSQQLSLNYKLVVQKLDQFTITMHMHGVDAYTTWRGHYELKHWRLSAFCNCKLIQFLNDQFLIQIQLLWTSCKHTKVAWAFQRWIIPSCTITGPAHDHISQRMFVELPCLNAHIQNTCTHTDLWKQSEMGNICVYLHQFSFLWCKSQGERIQALGNGPSEGDLRTP